jgi:PAS domain-containing protein
MAPSDGAREIRWRSANTYGPHGEFAGVMSVGEDITERAAFERERTRKAQEFDAIFNLTRDLFFRIDPDNMVVTYSAPSNDALYAPPSAFLGRDITAVLPPSVAEVLDSGKAQAHATGEMAVGEYELPLGDEMREWEARFLPLAGGDTAIVVRDITEAKAAERELRGRLESER